MRKNGGASYLGLAVIILLVIAILYVGISALQDQHVYQREAAITPTPSITPRTVRITEDPALPTSTPTPCILQKNSIGIEVKQLQQRLKDLGYYSGDVDGQYGTGTQTAAEQAFKVLRLKNYARMDFMMDEKGDFYCLEANTLPGMTPTSLLPQEAKVLGIEYADLCQLLIDISMRDE